VGKLIVRFLQLGVAEDGFVQFNYDISNLELQDHQGNTVFQTDEFDTFNQTATIDYTPIEAVHVEGSTQQRGSNPATLGIDIGLRARQLQRRLTIELESGQTEFDCSFDLPLTQIAVFQDPAQTCSPDEATELEQISRT
jgi:hypothetical protein